MKPVTPVVQGNPSYAIAWSSKRDDGAPYTISTLLTDHGLLKNVTYYVTVRYLLIIIFHWISKRSPYKTLLLVIFVLGSFRHKQSTVLCVIEKLYSSCSSIRNGLFEIRAKATENILSSSLYHFGRKIY